MNVSTTSARASFGVRLRACVDWRGLAIVSIAAVALETLRYFGMIADAAAPGVMFAAVWGVWLVVALMTALVSERDTTAAVWGACLVEVLSIGTIIYLTGWGPTLVIGFGAAASDRFRVYGSRATAPLMVASVVAMGLGQIAIALDLMPSFITSPAVQALGAVALAGLLIVLLMMGDQIRQREAAASHAHHSDEWFRALVQHASDAVVVFEPDGCAVKYASPAFERLLGLSSPRQLHLELIHQDDRASLANAITSMGDTAQIWVELRARHADGTFHTLEVGITNLTDNPSIEGFVANVRDVTERRLFEQQLSYQANHDSLTQLPNRRQFLERLDAALERTAVLRASVAVVFLDIDQFKVINDSLGHDVGDRLLVEIANRLRSCLRPGDVVARFGGDEFTVMLEDVGSSVDAIVVADRILAALREPVVVGGRELLTGASIGIAVSGVGGEGTDSGELLREADLAMYMAKERGRGRWELFDSQRAPEVIQRLETESGLRRAIDERQLVVHFQPEIALGHHEVVAFEALVRWEHPTRGLLLPGAFIPFAEESSLIVEIDHYVLHEAMRQVQVWNSEPGVSRPVRMSVNLSARSLHERDLVERIEAQLTETECRAEWLQVEVTERTAVDGDERAANALHALRALGVSIAIDDFGTGYSSLAYLRDLPVDVLKLDQSFIARIDADAQSAIVAAVITMGHALGVHVTAEGVEYGSQLAELRALGCDTAQGFHFSAAVPRDEVPDTVARIRGGALLPAGEPISTGSVSQESRPLGADQ